MSEQRLSKLQKWILIETYKKGLRQYEEEKTLEYFINTREIYERFYGIHNAIPRHLTVSLCRSLSILEQRAYIWRWRQASGHVKSIVFLTGNGAVKAKSITGSLKGTDYTIRKAIIPTNNGGNSV